jgi:broad specificity phosphatase PhoE
MSWFHLDFVYTSAPSRCIESGRIIAEPHGLEVKVVDDLNELHFGLWESLSYEEVQERYPEELESCRTTWKGTPLREAKP